MRDPTIPHSVFSPRDLVSEATIALTARPARTVLTALGTILGVAALVATLGLAKTAGSQIVSRFDELEATSIAGSAATTCSSHGASAGGSSRFVVPSAS